MWLAILVIWNVPRAAYSVRAYVAEELQEGKTLGRSNQEKDTIDFITEAINLPKFV